MSENLDFPNVLVGWTTNKLYKNFNDKLLYKKPYIVDKKFRPGDGSWVSVKPYQKDNSYYKYDPYHTGQVVCENPKNWKLQDIDSQQRFKTEFTFIPNSAINKEKILDQKDLDIQQEQYDYLNKEQFNTGMQGEQIDYRRFGLGSGRGTGSTTKIIQTIPGSNNVFIKPQSDIVKKKNDVLNSNETIQKLEQKIPELQKKIDDMSKKINRDQGMIDSQMDTAKEDISGISPIRSTPSTNSPLRQPIFLSPTTPTTLTSKDVTQSKESDIESTTAVVVSPSSMQQAKDNWNNTDSGVGTSVSGTSSSTEKKNGKGTSSKSSSIIDKKFVDIFNQNEIKIIVDILNAEDQNYGSTLKEAIKNYTVVNKKTGKKGLNGKITLNSIDQENVRDAFNQSTGFKK